MSTSAKGPSIGRFYTIRTVADRLGLSPRSVQRLIDSGVLPAFKFGGALRVSDEDLQLLVARSRQSKQQEQMT